MQENSGIHVVLLGRPYTTLSKTMNKGIPDIFASLGIRVYDQDMLACSDEDTLPHSRTSGAGSLALCRRDSHGGPGDGPVSERAYPVMVTSFRCSPDAFVMDYFKEIMESHHKPYLILQLDEHESNVGYETRIEAAIRSFQNHHAATKREIPARAPARFPVTSKDLSHKTLIIPNWDNITFQFLVANLRRGRDRRQVDGRIPDDHSEEPSIQYGPVHPLEHHRPGICGVCERPPSGP